MPIAERETVVHAFCLILCYSRRLFVAFFRDERLPTLLWAHQEAFRYHAGLCRRIAYDNQTAITLGRLRGQPRWHPTFLAFARHYGFAPAVGPPRAQGTPRQGRAPLRLPRGGLPARPRTFASWDDLHAQTRQWLDTVANVRVHGTTRRRIDEAFAEEQPCLIPLPAVPYPAARQETAHGPEGRLHPHRWLVLPRARPAAGPDRDASRIDPVRVQILDAAGAVVATHPVPDQPTRLPAGAAAARAASARPAPAPPRRPPSWPASPTPRDFLDGLTQRMTTLTPIHLRALERLADLYGEPAVHAALDRRHRLPQLQRPRPRAHPPARPSHRRARARVPADAAPRGPRRPGRRRRRLAPGLHPGLHAPDGRPCPMARKPDPPDPVARGPRAAWSGSTSPPRRAASSELLAQAETAQPAYSAFLHQILEAEDGARWERKLQRRRRWSKLGPPVTLEGFDWAARPQLSPQVVKELLTCRFVDEHRNVILVGRPSTGKTTVAKALGHAACARALSVYYAPMAEVLQTLHAARADGTYRKVFRRVTGPDLVILDDAGFTELGRDAANELFRVVSARHRVRSTVVVSNFPFKHWAEFLPSPAQAVAIADRLVDDATILRFSGKPYRQPRDVHGAPLDGE